VVVSTQSNRVALVGNDGESKWTREFDRPVVGVDLSSLGNTVVVGLRTGELYCLDEDGDELWSYNLHARLEDVQISKSGRYIVAGSRDTYTYFFDSTGLLLWRSKADGRIRQGIGPLADDRRKTGKRGDAGHGLRGTDYGQSHRHRLEHLVLDAAGDPQR